MNYSSYLLKFIWAIRKSFEKLRQEGMIVLITDAVRIYNYKFIFIPQFPGVTLGINGFVWTVGLQTKYLDFDSRIMPNATDSNERIVLEAGVYDGRDTATFAKLSDRVFAFEPSPRNYQKASVNLRKFDNIELINAGLWSHPSELEIQFGEHGADDGFLQPDVPRSEQHDDESVIIRVDTIENFVSELNIEPTEIELIKIEAEGAEPEILKGLGSIRPTHIVINADEERDGKPTGLAVAKKLQPLGYELVGIKNGCMLFFTQRQIRSAFRNEFST
jgi:FkbM family methyltransferase